MKKLNQYINEKLILKKKKKTEHTLFPKTRSELANMIKDEVEKNGWECDLNHIDVSQIKNISHLFAGELTLNYGLKEFNGDISEWDVSNVTDMVGTFNNSYFNGDLSSWKLDNVKDAQNLFSGNSKFNNPSICDWDVSNIKIFFRMFYGNTTFNQDLSKWKISDGAECSSMFKRTNLKDAYKPKGIK
jgi:surface protein